MDYHLIPWPLNLVHKIGPVPASILQERFLTMPIVKGIFISICCLSFEKPVNYFIGPCAQIEHRIWSGILVVVVAPSGLTVMIARLSKI